MAKLQCEIVTPTHVVFRGEAALVEVPSVLGYAGILPGHEDFSCRMQNGKVTVFTDEEHKEKLEFASYMGFTHVHKDKVIVLSREGIAINEINESQVRKEAEELKVKIDAMSAEEIEGQAKRAEKVQRNTLTDDLEWREVMLSFCAK